MSKNVSKFVRSTTKKKKRKAKTVKVTPAALAESQTEEMRKRGFITPTEAATRMIKPYSHIHRAIAAGDLKFETVGHSKYVEWESFKEFAGILAGDLNTPPVADAD